MESNEESINHKRVTDEISLAVSGGNKTIRIFLNPVGKAYPYSLIKRILEAIEKKLPVAWKVIKPFFAKIRPLTWGLGVGSPDFIAIKKVLITPEMVGQHIGVFCAIEAKTKNDTTSPEQDNFIQIIKELGGWVGVAKEPFHVEQAIAILNNKQD